MALLFDTYILLICCCCLILCIVAIAAIVILYNSETIMKKVKEMSNGKLITKSKIEADDAEFRDANE